MAEKQRRNFDPPEDSLRGPPPLPDDEKLLAF